MTRIVRLRSKPNFEGFALLFEDKEGNDYKLVVEIHNDGKSIEIKSLYPTKIYNQDNKEAIDYDYIIDSVKLQEGYTNEDIEKTILQVCNKITKYNISFPSIISIQLLSLLDIVIEYLEEVNCKIDDEEINLYKQKLVRRAEEILFGNERE